MTKRGAAELQQAKRRAEVAEWFRPGWPHRHQKVEGRADPGEGAERSICHKAE